MLNVSSGLQQLVVITGLHYIFGAIEAQLLADTGRNFLNPLMSVAIIAQGGAVLGYMLRHQENLKVREMCVSDDNKVLFTDHRAGKVFRSFLFPLPVECSTQFF